MASHFAFTDVCIPLLDAAELSKRLQNHERACVAAGQSRIRGNFLTRARRILERLQARSGAAHLKPEELRQLAPIARGIRLVHLPDADAADRIAAELHAEMPWMAPANRIVWQAIRLAARTGAPIRVPPLLLVGPPGIGKSAWARRLAELLQVPSAVVEATNEPAGFAIAGLQAGWG